MTEQNQDENKQNDNNQPDTATPEVASTAPPSVQEKIKRADKPAPVKARLGWGARSLLLLSLLLAAAAAGLVGYQFYVTQQEKLQILSDREELNRTLQARAHRLEQLENGLTQLTNQLKQEREALKSANQSRELLQSRIAVLEKDIAAISGAHRIDWMLREVEHFITVAEQRLTLLGDAAGALALLQEADDIVRAMQEPGARPLREALVRDVHKLKLAAETNIDVEGIFLRLSDLSDRVVKLGIPSFELKQEPLEPAPGEVLPEEGMALFWYRFKKFLGSLYDYQKHPKGRPITLTEDREFLARNVIMLLQQAQLALLRGDSEAYRVSLTGARERVEMYIHQQTGETRFFVTEISDLLKVKLRPPMPTIEESIRGVRVFRDYWNKEKLIREQQVQKLEQRSRQESAQ
ncbi:MAG: uroporphyrinogen-III C-methyltransferase [Pseudomonadota bacterium]|nr:uroporphyrinogen-III C-methyltransferase [Pseudomonadota bacterium]